MKVVILLLLSVTLTLASIPSPSQDSKLETQSAVVCTTSQYICSTVNGTCNDFTVGTIQYRYRCPSFPIYTTQVYVLNRTSFNYDCVCQQAAVPTAVVTPTLGANCSVLDSAPALYQCARDTRRGQNQYRWYSKKTIGDYCSSDYDCSPTASAGTQESRRCISGVCQAYLNVGDVCYNLTVNYLNFCPVNSACMPLTGFSRTCVARGAAGAACTTASDCPTYQECDFGTCTNPRRYYIPGGVKANTTQQECQSGLWWDSFNKTCIDYNYIYNTYLPLDGTSCSDTTACSWGSCDCFTTGSTSVAKCSWDHSTPATAAKNYDTTVTNAANLYNAGCEANPYYPQTSSNDFCIVRVGPYSPSTITNACAAARLLSPDCGAIALACGAIHQMMVSVVTLVVLALAAVLMPQFA